jgi:DNA-directed RNA polymerase subunit M/transcription elongation factor TFIIS
MAILMRVSCPECGAGLKADDPAGFEVGQALECPKCETYFAVEAPRAAAVAKPVAKAKKPVVVVEVDDEDDDDRPRKKRRRDYDDEDDDRPRKKKKFEESGYARYRTSPIRFVILGVLILILIVMAVLLKMKWDREKQDQTSMMHVQLLLT